MYKVFLLSAGNTFIIHPSPRAPLPQILLYEGERSLIPKQNVYLFA